MRKNSRGPIRQQNQNGEKATKPFFNSGQHDQAKQGDTPFFQTQLKPEEEQPVQKQEDDKDKPVQKTGAEDKKDEVQKKA